MFNKEHYKFMGKNSKWILVANYMKIHPGLLKTEIWTENAETASFPLSACVIN